MSDTYGKADFRNFVGSRIRYFREQAGLTQMQLAFLSDLDRSFIQNVERGRQSISFENMWRIARSLKRQLSDFAPPIDEKSERHD
jgi:transcriptional regulator with XRE-family HTH domain